MLANVLSVLHQPVTHELLEMGTDSVQPRDAIDYVLGQVEPIQMIEYGHVKWGRRCALLLIAVNVQIVMVGTAIGAGVRQGIRGTSGLRH